MRQSFSTQPALFAFHKLLEHPALGALDTVEEVIDWSRIEALLPRGEMGWLPPSPDGIAMCQDCGVERHAKRRTAR